MYRVCIGTFEKSDGSIFTRRGEVELKKDIQSTKYAEYIICLCF